MVNVNKRVIMVKHFGQIGKNNFPPKVTLVKKCIVVIMVKESWLIGNVEL